MIQLISILLSAIIFMVMAFVYDIVWLIVICGLTILIVGIYTIVYFVQYTALKLEFKNFFKNPNIPYKSYLIEIVYQSSKIDITHKESVGKAILDVLTKNKMIFAQTETNFYGIPLIPLLLPPHGISKFLIGLKSVSETEFMICIRFTEYVPPGDYNFVKNWGSGIRDFETFDQYYASPWLQKIDESLRSFNLEWEWKPVRDK